MKRPQHRRCGLFAPCVWEFPGIRIHPGNWGVGPGKRGRYGQAASTVTPWHHPDRGGRRDSESATPAKVHRRHAE